MKKDIKGFTLVELLAVIVVLGVIMTIAGTSLIGTRKKANQSEVKSIYNTIKEIGPDVYLDKKDNIENDYACYSDKWLKENGYLKSEVSNPAKSEEQCEAYLIIDKSSDDDMFKAYVGCDGLEPEGDRPPETESCKR